MSRRPSKPPDANGPLSPRAKLALAILLALLVAAWVGAAARVLCEETGDDAEVGQVPDAR